MAHHLGLLRVPGEELAIAEQGVVRLQEVIPGVVVGIVLRERVIRVVSYHLPTMKFNLEILETSIMMER